MEEEGAVGVKELEAASKRNCDLVGPAKKDKIKQICCFKFWSHFCGFTLTSVQTA